MKLAERLALEAKDPGYRPGPSHQAMYAMITGLTKALRQRMDDGIAYAQEESKSSEAGIRWPEQIVSRER